MCKIDVIFSLVNIKDKQTVAMSLETDMESTINEPTLVTERIEL